MALGLCLSLGCAFSLADYASDALGMGVPACPGCFRVLPGCPRGRRPYSLLVYSCPLEGPPCTIATA